MLVAALFLHDGIPQDVLHLPVHVVAFEIAQLDAAARQHGHVAIGQKEHVARMAEDRRHVRSHEIFTVAQADHHRRTFPGCDDFIRIVAAQNGQRKDAAELFHRAANGLFEVAFEVFLYQVGNHFGVGLGDESVAFLLEFFFELQVIFDDSVVNHDDIASAVAMLVGIFLGRAAVRRPARVADAVGAIHGVQLQHVFEVAKFAGSAANAEGLVIAINGEARRVIAAIFQLLQAFENDGYRALRPHVTDNSTHAVIVRNLAADSPARTRSSDSSMADLVFSNFPARKCGPGASAECPRFLKAVFAGKVGQA